ncbi:MAG: hypothetical protein Q8900_05075 [Bacillota bacterium]|nr:hypothetical protein [Bacillota bacterium]
MTQKKSYSRYFIILQEEEKGYSLASDKLPSGYAKLEIKNDKCKISYYVQNLKKERQPYFMILICYKKGVEKVINLGELNIDDYGRTEISREYQSDNIGGSNISVDKVVGAAIVKFDGKFIFSVMSGFSVSEIPEWKNLTVFTQAVEKVEEKIEVKSEFDKYESIIETMKENPVNNHADKEENALKENLEPVSVNDGNKAVETLSENDSDQITETFAENDVLENAEPDTENKTRHEEENATQEQIQKIIEQEPNIKINEESPEEQIPEMQNYEEPSQEIQNEEITEKLKPECYSCNKKTENYLSVNKFFTGVVEEFKELGDLCHEIKRCKWYEAEVKSVEYLYDTSNYDRYVVAYYPMLSYYEYIKSYGHFVLGYKCNINGELKYIVYGIKGRRHRKDQPFGGKTGFVTWIPLKEDEENEDSLGYWLLFYDYKNTVVVVPVK